MRAPIATHPTAPQYFMAVDQYGATYHGLTHPRRDLLDRLDAKHADKMYVDALSGECVHIGYVIKGLWLTVYKVERAENFTNNQ